MRCEDENIGSPPLHSLVVAVVLVAVDDHFVADFPPLHLGTDCPHDAGGVGSRDMERLLVASSGEMGSPSAAQTPL